ncbi:MAG TPA: thioredoxin [Clostridiaceae bacterium]|nr:thioredoxin [Clostridiaceae bacterium]
MASGKVKELTKDNFEEEVISSGKLFLVDFWAEWCGPCRAVAPIIDELAEFYEGKLTVGKVNVDNEGALAEKYRIMSIPTIMIFKEGKMVERIVGARSAQEFKSVIDKYLS